MLSLMSLQFFLSDAILVHQGPSEAGLVKGGSQTVMRASYCLDQPYRELWRASHAWLKYSSLTQSLGASCLGKALALSQVVLPLRRTLKECKAECYLLTALLVAGQRVLSSNEIQMAHSHVYHRFAS